MAKPHDFTVHKPTVVPALPGYEYVVPEHDGKSDHVDGLYGTPIIAWSVSVVTEDDYFSRAEWYPICVEDEATSVGTYAIKQPDGRYCFPGRCTVSTESEAITVFSDDIKRERELRMRRRDAEPRRPEVVH